MNFVQNRARRLEETLATTALVVAVGSAIVLPATRASAQTLALTATRFPVSPAPDTVAPQPNVPANVPDSLFGRSGKLRFRLFGETRSFLLPVLQRLFGDTVGVRAPGVYAASADTLGRPFAFISMIPFSAKAGGRLGEYRIGFWPGERRRAAASFDRPEGFIEVTPENQDMHISEHFRLRDFLTHDQTNVWPKYLVLREDLVDKLELVIDDLERHGVKVHRMVVMSGFRTPQYNARGVGRGGRAQDSRHLYGDAADVFVDNDGNGRMDDLNRDGRVDSRDARVILNAVERVERVHPELVGGAALYRATRAHGPFAHVDVRGRRARWGRA